jgi:radical SAM-linked protein
MACDKIRIRFCKGEALRLVSHHDLVRCFERMLRRSGLPFHSSQGFNPKPRLVIALSLGLGLIGCHEVAELELDQQLPIEEIWQRLELQAPPGLEIREVRRIPSKVRAQVLGVSYRLAVPAERKPELAKRIENLLKEPHCWIDRTRPHQRRLDLRPYMRDFHLGNDFLVMNLRVSPQGTARAEEVLGLVGLSDLLASGALVERIRMELEDENEDLQHREPHEERNAD